MKNRIIQLLGGVPRSEFDAAVRRIDSCRSDIAYQQAIIKDIGDATQNAIERIEANHSACLQQIAACETPNSNGTVRKMARLAREGLGQ